MLHFCYNDEGYTKRWCSFTLVTKDKTENVASPLQRQRIYEKVVQFYLVTKDIRDNAAILLQ